MIINRPAIDWLTLTTYDLKEQRAMGAMLLRHLPHAGTESRPMTQGLYNGRGGNGWFGGEGNQNGKQHFLYRFSGDLSDAIAFDPLRPVVECTRLDIQLTLPLPCPIEQAYDQYTALSSLMAEHERGRGQRGRKVGGPLYPNGECTLYVGTRQGTERFYRLYTKEGDEGEWFIRFEIELKNKAGMAGRAWRAIGNDPLAVVSLLAGELSTMPQHALLTPFHEQMTHMPQELMKQERRRTEPNKTLQWIMKQVDPSIRKLLGYHDTSDQMQAILVDWLTYAANLGQQVNE